MDFEKIEKVLDDFDNTHSCYANQMIAILKEDCPTYGDIDEAIAKIERDIIWRGQRHRLLLIEEVRKVLNDEKSRLSPTVC